MAKNLIRSLVLGLLTLLLLGACNSLSNQRFIGKWVGEYRGDTVIINIEQRDDDAFLLQLHEDESTLDVIAFIKSDGCLHYDETKRTQYRISSGFKLCLNEPTDQLLIEIEHLKLYLVRAAK